MCPVISPDFSEAVDFAPITPGTYKARILGVKNLETKAGKQRLSWEMEIFGAEDTKLNNRKFFYSTMLSGPGAGMLKKLLEVTVGPVDAAAGFDTDALLGKTLQVVLVEGRNNQTGEATGYADVKSIAKLTG